MNALKKFRSLLLLTLVLGLTFGNYSCKKEKSTINNSGNSGGNNNTNNDDNCDTPLETHEITFSGQDMNHLSLTNEYRYKFTIDTMIVNRTVNYLMDWSCNKIKYMYLELNDSREDSLDTWIWNWTDSSLPGSTTFSAANRREGDASQHTISVHLVEKGVGESYIDFAADTSYAELGIENYYDPNGDYKLTFVYYEE